MATLCTKGGSGEILGTASSPKSCQVLVRAAQGVVGSPSLKVFKQPGDVALRDVGRGYGRGGLGLEILEVFSNLCGSVVYIEYSKLEETHRAT